MRQPASEASTPATNSLERILLAADAYDIRHRLVNGDERVAKALELIHTHFASSPPLEFMAREVGLSRTRFTELFQSPGKETPLAVCGEASASARAAVVGIRAPLTLGEIADRLQFSSPFYLSLRFKKEFGISPVLYRKRSAGRSARWKPPFQTNRHSEAEKFLRFADGWLGNKNQPLPASPVSGSPCRSGPPHAPCHGNAWACIRARGSYPGASFRAGFQSGIPPVS